MSTLFLRNLVFNGVHGLTGREVSDKQRFEIQIDIELDTEKAEKSDVLGDTYDYKNAVNIAKHIIESERHVLIEKIARRIAERICLDPKIFTTKVTIKKLDASINGIPGITIKHKRAPQEIDQGLINFDLNTILETIDKEGAISIPILNESYRQELLNEAEGYKYEKQPEVVGPHKVREQISSNYKFHPGSLFVRLKEDFQTLLNQNKSDSNYPFSPNLDFNELSLQLYEKGSIGITPHLDNFSSKNLICIFVITGHAKFALCDDREGSNPRFLDTTPGNVIIMRAPGFKNQDIRPFHFVNDITERRIVFGLRQNIKQ